MASVHFTIAALVAAAGVQAIPFDPFFYVDEWEGACVEGKYQTGINIVTADAKKNPLPTDWATDFKFPVVSGVKMANVGNGEKYEWDGSTSEMPTIPAGGDRISAILLDPSIPIDREVKVQPIQFHFHSVSEHLLDGLYYMAESHIVTLVAKGEAPEWGCDEIWDGGDPVLENCTAVFGTNFILGEEDGSAAANADAEPSWLQLSIDEGPLAVNDKEYTYFSEGEIDLNTLIPSDTSYYTYYGSLTTPPCSEGLRWHVFEKPLTMRPSTFEKMENYLAYSTDPEDPDKILGYRNNHRFPNPLNGRQIWYYKDPAAPASAEPTCACDDMSGMYGDMA